MNESQRTLLKTITVTTADDITALWGALMGDAGFGRRTLWLVVLEEDGRPTPVVVPIDDIPRIPTPRDIEAFRQVANEMLEWGTLVMLISRPGVDAVREDDRRWARALAPLAPAWPIHLGTMTNDGRCRIRSITS